MEKNPMRGNSGVGNPVDPRGRKSEDWLLWRKNYLINKNDMLIAPKGSQFFEPCHMKQNALEFRAVSLRKNPTSLVFQHAMVERFFLKWKNFSTSGGADEIPFILI